MKVEQGRQAVWELAKECGMADDIKKIAQYFDIADISIISGEKMTFLHERPRKMHRVPAIPTKIDFKSVIDSSREQRRRFK
ncbi:TPA: hypothetical protein H1940_004780 [Salmonella enterica]|nr:hypothetical protein [Salmonella enterica]